MPDVWLSPDKAVDYLDNWVESIQICKITFRQESILIMWNYQKVNILCGYHPTFISPLLRVDGICFHICIALTMTLLRLFLWDYHNFFELFSLPQHDMNQGLAYFATNMHCLRIAGDLAYWNPASNLGYPQYQQMFLAPLAPNPGHLVFMLWANLVIALAHIGKAMPEYYQYLTVNYIVLPFLSFWAFAAFFGNIFKSRITIFWLSLGYALSGIGLWQSGWFYFQESFTFFSVLAAITGFLKASQLDTHNSRTRCWSYTNNFIELLDYL